MSASAPPVIEDVTLEQLERDPYPTYARLRRESPVAYLPLVDQWLVTRWEDCEEIARDESRIGPMVQHLHEFFGPNILTSDGDVHTWLRSGVDPPLRPRAVRGYIEQLTRPVAKRYVEQVRPRGAADASTELLELISVRVIGDVLGLRDVPDATLQRWFHGLNGGMTNAAGDEGTAMTSDEVKAELDDYMRDAIERLTREPDDSGLSHMIHSEIRDGVTRTFEDLIGTIRVIILGGFQEPGHGAAASLLGVLLDPRQLQAVLDDPDRMIPAAVHEGLRWIAPFGVVERQALVDIEVNGVTIPAGKEIALACSSANRDERRYEDGERFDLFRPHVNHASFGYGAHFCSGHFVARRLEQIALEEVFLGLPNLRLDPDREPNVFGFTVRGVKNLPVVWDA